MKASQKNNSSLILAEFKINNMDKRKKLQNLMLEYNHLGKQIELLKQEIHSTELYANRYLEVASEKTGIPMEDIIGKRKHHLIRVWLVNKFSGIGMSYKEIIDKMGISHRNVLKLKTDYLELRKDIDFKKLENKLNEI